jgi:hypothetical protein
LSSPLLTRFGSFAHNSSIGSDWLDASVAPDIIPNEGVVAPTDRSLLDASSRCVSMPSSSCCDSGRSPRRSHGCSRTHGSDGNATLMSLDRASPPDGLRGEAPLSTSTIVEGLCRVGLIVRCLHRVGLTVRGLLGVGLAVEALLELTSLY